MDRLDGLFNSTQDPEAESGVSLLDLTDLPPVQRRIMRLLLRAREMTYVALCQAAEKAPEEERLTQSEIDEGLKQLIADEWVVLQEMSEGPLYKVNFRRKMSRNLSRTHTRGRPRSSSARGIWEALDSLDGSVAPPGGSIVPPPETPPAKDKDA